MKSLLHITLVSLVITAMITTSCQKEEERHGIGYCSYKDTTFLKHSDLLHCKYKTNTYWVYYDSVKTLIDSVFINKVKRKFIQDYCAITEFYTYTTLSTQSSTPTLYTLVPAGLFKATYNSYNGLDAQVYSPINKKDSSLFEQPGYIYDTLFANKLIYNEYYEHVMRVTITNDKSEQNRKSIYFVNSDFGILKHEIYDENNNLISNKVLLRKEIIR